MVCCNFIMLIIVVNIYVFKFNSYYIVWKIEFKISCNIMMYKNEFESVVIK